MNRAERRARAWYAKHPNVPIDEIAIGMKKQGFETRTRIAEHAGDLKAISKSTATVKKQVAGPSMPTVKGLLSVQQPERPSED